MANYYLNSSGNDTNNGLSTNSTGAWLTVSSAVTRITKGDTLFIGGSTYVDSINACASGVDTNSTGLVTIRNMPGETVWLKPSTTAFRVIDWSQTGTTRQFIVFDGINLDGGNCQNETVKMIDGTTYANCNQCQFKNLQAKGPIVPYSSALQVQGFLIAAGDTTSIGKNLFSSITISGGLGGDFDHMFYIQSPDNVIDACEIFDFPGGGIQIYNAGNANIPSSNTIKNCNIHDARQTTNGQRHVGIVMTGVDGIVVNNIVNNIVSDGAAAVGLNAFTGSSARFVNNTIYRTGGNGIQIDSGVSATIVHNNVLSSCSSGIVDSGTASTITNNSVNVADPGFVNAPSSNFHLAAGSTLINAAIVDTLASPDRDGYTRPQGSSYDIGVYEFIAASGSTVIGKNIGGRVTHTIAFGA